MIEFLRRINNLAPVTYATLGKEMRSYAQVGKYLTFCRKCKLIETNRAKSHNSKRHLKHYSLSEKGKQLLDVFEGVTFGGNR